MNRGTVALIIYDELYGEGTDPFDFPAANFPSPFLDQQEPTDVRPYVNILSFLEYDNGVPAIPRDLIIFDSPREISKLEFIRWVLEAWDIEPSSATTLPYNDYPNASFGPEFGYVRKAWELGLLTNASNLFPYDFISLSYVENFIDNLNNLIPPPSFSELQDLDNYFIPNNYTPKNFGFLRGLEQGVFSHYAKDSFVIPDIKFNLNFSHYYSTTLVEIPEKFFPLKPLSRGWTHTYNSYIIRENNVGEDEIDYYNIVWPDGTIHIYNEDDEEYVTLGVYDELQENTSGYDIVITKKNQVKYFYDRYGIPGPDEPIYYLEKIEDPNGNEILLSYEESDVDDRFARLETVIAPSGKELNFSYHNNTDFIASIEDPINREIQFEYNEERLKYFYDAKNLETKYFYVSNDEGASEENQYKRFLLRKIRLPKGNEIEAEYDEDNNGKLERYTLNNDDPIDVDVEFDYEDENPIEATVDVPMPNGGTQEYNYIFNENGRLVSFENDSDKIEVSYPDTGEPNITLPSNSNRNGVDIAYEYDDNGNVTEIDIENGDIVEEFDYDNDNNLIIHVDPEGNETNYTYDNDENLIEIQDPYNNVIVLEYDNKGQLISTTNQEGIIISYSYENDGAISSINAPEGISSNFSYDGINRLLQTNSNGLISQYSYDDNDNITFFSNSGGVITTYDYDDNDNLEEITNANNIDTSFEYDDEDRVIEERFGNLIKEYEYGNEGFLEQYTKPSGETINYEYDDEGRLEETGTITDINYNNRNLIESISNDYGTIEFEYDNINRVDEVTTVHGFEVKYDYEDTSQIDEIEYPVINGIELEVDVSFDDKNRVFQVIVQKNVGQENVVIAEYDYLDDDRVEEINYGNNTRTDYGYDNAGRFNYIEHFELGAPTSFYVEGSTLDTRGNITDTFELVTPMPVGFNDYGTSSDNVDYNYNDNNHINNANSTDYNVDDDGNTVSASGDFSSQYDIDDRLTDYNDVDNNTDFEYNAFNQRVETRIDGVTTKFVRDVLKDNILVELDQNDNPIYYYIYHPSGMLLARMKPNGDLQYYYGDTRGSTVAILDEDANITHLYRYEDFGWVTKESEPVNENNRFKYVGTYGVEYDKQDLYYMRARYYRPSIGRFLTEDPVWHTNLYPYADNNPISRIDPLGTESIFANEYLSNLFYKNGYGDAANILSEESAAWDFALNNPEIAGFAVGVGVGLSAGAFANGIIYGIAAANGAGSVGSQYLIANSAKSLYYLYSAAGYGNKGEKLFLYLGRYEDGTDMNKLFVEE